MINIPDYFRGKLHNPKMFAKLFKIDMNNIYSVRFCIFWDKQFKCISFMKYVLIPYDMLVQECQKSHVWPGESYLSKSQFNYSIHDLKVP